MSLYQMQKFLFDINRDPAVQKQFVAERTRALAGYDLTLEERDGIIAGDPVIHLPLGPMNGVFTSQIFAGLATRSGLFLANGDPALLHNCDGPDTPSIS